MAAPRKSWLYTPKASAATPEDGSFRLSILEKVEQHLKITVTQNEDFWSHRQRGSYAFDDELTQTMHEEGLMRSNLGGKLSPL